MAKYIVGKKYWVDQLVWHDYSEDDRPTLATLYLVKQRNRGVTMLTYSDDIFDVESEGGEKTSGFYKEDGFSEEDDDTPKYIIFPPASESDRGDAIEFWAEIPRFYGRAESGKKIYAGPLNGFVYDYQWKEIQNPKD